ncbi:MAG: hypothetical protein FWD59_10320 [Micrococcales bacterium]|nr:hypothetical protein [Micrococcales bacterium]
MSQPWTDVDRARLGVADPATPPGDLAEIARLHPGLRMRVAWHNATYPGLLEWLSKYGGPGVAAAVLARRNADQAVLNQTLSFPAAYGTADARKAAALGGVGSRPAPSPARPEEKPSLGEGAPEAESTITLKVEEPPKDEAATPAAVLEVPDVPEVPVAEPVVVPDIPDVPEVPERVSVVKPAVAKPAVAPEIPDVPEAPERVSIVKPTVAKPAVAPEIPDVPEAPERVSIVKPTVAPSVPAVPVVPEVAAAAKATVAPRSPDAPVVPELAKALVEKAPEAAPPAGSVPARERPLPFPRQRSVPARAGQYGPDRDALDIHELLSSSEESDAPELRLSEQSVARISAAAMEAALQHEAAFDLPRVLSSDTLSPVRRRPMISSPVAPIDRSLALGDPSVDPGATRTAGAPGETRDADDPPPERPRASTLTKVLAVVTLAMALAAIIIGVILLTLPKPTDVVSGLPATPGLRSVIVSQESGPLSQEALGVDQTLG